MTGPGGKDMPAGADYGGAPVGFKRHLRSAVVPGEAVYLVSQRGITALRGPHACVLAPLLDGTRNMKSVLRDAAPALSTEEAGQSLRRLVDIGLVRSYPPAGTSEPQPAADPAAEAYWDLAGLDGGLASEQLRGARIRIEATTPLDPQPVAVACRDSGLRVVGEGEAADFSLVFCDDYLAPELAGVDARHRADGTPWMIAKVSGAEPWIGPVFRPDGGPCWSCLAVRLRGHRRSEEPVQRALGLAGPLSRPAASLASCRSAAMHVAVLESTKWLAGLRCPAQDSVHTMDTLLMESRLHPVARRPQCPVCGDPRQVADRVRAPFVPVSRPKATQDVNGHRALTAGQMLDRYGHLVGPVTGIVKEIRRAPRAPGFVSAYLSGHNLAVGSDTLSGLRAGLRSLSGGKGLSEVEARTSALCEAVERFSATRHGDEPTVRDTYRGLGAAAVHPNACQLYDPRQYRDRGRWNASRSHFQHVPERFDADRPTEWTPVWSLTGRTHRLLPTSMLYFANGAGAADGLSADSNGNAAGSSPEDALVQGFLELVERDAVALWWYNRTRHPAVDLDSFDEPYVERLRAGYRGIHREVWVLDLTSDLGIPTMAALSRRTDKPAQDVIFGFGAHFDPRIALRRALTEMGQLLPAVCDARPDGSGYGIDDREPRDWWQHAGPAGHPYLTPDPEQPARSPASWPYTPHADLVDDVAAITELVRSHGLDLLILDQTRPDLGIPVVKVIVPGLRHFWARLAPGRLFDVPVALGQLTEPTPYARLNPVPLFV